MRLTLNHIKYHFLTNKTFQKVYRERSVKQIDSEFHQLIKKPEKVTRNITRTSQEIRINKSSVYRKDKLRP